MSFTEERRTAIQKYMLDKIRSDDPDFIRKTADNFEISETSVRRYIRTCLDNNYIYEESSRNTGFCLKTVSRQWQAGNDGTLEEDTMFWQNVAPFLEALRIM